MKSNVPGWIRKTCDLLFLYSKAEWCSGVLLSTLSPRCSVLRWRARARRRKRCAPRIANINFSEGPRRSQLTAASSRPVLSGRRASG